MFDFNTQYDVHSAIGSESPLMSVDQISSSADMCDRSSSPGLPPWSPDLSLFKYVFWNLNSSNPNTFSSPPFPPGLPASPPTPIGPLPDNLMGFSGTVPFLHEYTFDASPSGSSSPATPDPLLQSQCTGTYHPCTAAATTAAATTLPRTTTTTSATTTTTATIPNPDHPSSSSSLSPRCLSKTPIQCFQHGCGGRRFSSLGNYVRHIREKSGSAKRFVCKKCGQNFTRSTAKNKHVREARCRLQDFSWADDDHTAGGTSFDMAARSTDTQ